MDSLSEIYTFLIRPALQSLTGFDLSFFLNSYLVQVIPSITGYDFNHIDAVVLLLEKSSVVLVLGLFICCVLSLKSFSFRFSNDQTPFLLFSCHQISEKSFRHIIQFHLLLSCQVPCGCSVFYSPILCFYTINWHLKLCAVFL